MTVEYEGVWTWKAKAKSYWIDTKDGSQPQPISDSIVKGQFLQHVPAAIGGFIQQLLDSNADYATVTSYEVDIHTETISIRDISHIKGVQHLVGTFQVSTELNVYFKTDYPLAESPIAPTMVVAISVAIAIILAGVGAFMALKGLTTTTKTVTWKKTTTQPDGTIIEAEGSETITEPSLAGIVGSGGILIVLVLAVILGLVFFGRTRK